MRIGHIVKLPHKFDLKDGKLVVAHILVAFIALLIGGIAGLLQTMVKSGTVKLPYGIGYYELLTAHGVLMAIVFTTYFIIGFLYSGISYTLGGKLLPVVHRMGWAGFILMTTGTVLGVAMVLTGKASVLYTFYAPLKASPYFYIGLALLVVGSWISGWGIFYQYKYWKKTNHGKLSPLFAFMAVVTFLMWQIATIGVAAEVLIQLIP
ncbi:cbb3-type cytochrome c oxidase subunit I, partial [Paenibacillus sp. TAF58]